MLWDYLLLLVLATVFLLAHCKLMLQYYVISVFGMFFSKCLYHLLTQNKLAKSHMINTLNCRKLGDVHTTALKPNLKYQNCKC